MKCHAENITTKANLCAYVVIYLFCPKVFLRYHPQSSKSINLNSVINTQQSSRKIVINGVRNRQLIAI